MYETRRSYADDPRFLAAKQEDPGWSEVDEWYPPDEFDFAEAKEFERELPKFDPWYLVTGRAFLRIVEASSSLAAFGLVTWVNALFTPTYVVQTTLLSCFLVSCFFLVVYSANIVRASKVRWIFHELVFTGLACYMVFLSILIMAYSALRWRHTPWVFSVLFLLFAQIAFLADFGTLLSVHRRQPACRHSDGSRLRDLGEGSVVA